MGRETRLTSQKIYRHKEFYNPPRLFTELDHDQQHKVSSYELFYDLIFVAAVLNLGDFLKHNIASNAAGGIFTVFLLYSCMWWTWCGLHEYVTRFATDDLFHSFFFFVQFAATTGMAALMPQDDLSKDAHLNIVGFAVSVVISKVGSMCMHLWVWFNMANARPTCGRFAIGQGISALLWLVSAVMPSGARTATIVLWVVGLVAEVVCMYLVHSLPPAKALKIRIEHTAERHGLLVMILLGETIIGLVRTHPDTSKTFGEYFGVLISGIVLVFCLQLLYYEVQPDSMREEHALKRDLVHGWAFTLSHLLLQVSLVCVGVGVKIELAHPHDDIRMADTAPAAVHRRLLAASESGAAGVTYEEATVVNGAWLLFGGVFTSVLALNIIRLSHKSGRFVNDLLKDAVVSDESTMRSRSLSTVERQLVVHKISGEKRKMWFFRFCCSLLLVISPVLGYAGIKPWLSVAIAALVTLILVFIDAYGKSVAFVSKAKAAVQSRHGVCAMPANHPSRLRLKVEKVEAGEGDHPRRSRRLSRSGSVRFTVDPNSPIEAVKVSFREENSFIESDLAVVLESEEESQEEEGAAGDREAQQLKEAPQSEREEAPRREAAVCGSGAQQAEEAPQRERVEAAQREAVGGGREAQQAEEAKECTGSAGGRQSGAECRPQPERGCVNGAGPASASGGAGGGGGRGGAESGAIGADDNATSATGGGGAAGVDNATGTGDASVSVAAQVDAEVV